MEGEDLPDDMTPRLRDVTDMLTLGLVVGHRESNCNIAL